MLAGVEDGQHIHLRMQLEVSSCFGVVGVKTDSSVGIDIDAAEEVNVGYQVARSKTRLRQFDQEAVAAISVIVVAHFLAGSKTVLLLDRLPIGGSADRVVPTRRIGDNRARRILVKLKVRDAGGGLHRGGRTAADTHPGRAQIDSQHYIRPLALPQDSAHGVWCRTFNSGGDQS